MRPANFPRAARDLKLFFLLLCTFLALPALGYASNTYYVSQAGGSVNCGADGTQSTQPYTWVNTSGHYAAGDTIKLCGTINGPNTVGGVVLTLQASGASGNPITLFWESNASISEPACGGGNGSGCIKTNNQTFWIFDGNGTPNSVTSTQNGTAGTYANQTPANGIWALNCSNCEFKNLSITNIYVMNSTNDSAPNTFPWDPSGIVISGSNYSIHDNSITQMRSAIVGGLWNNGDTNNQVYNNTIQSVGGGIIYVGNTAGILSNIFVHDNHISNMNNWDNVNDYYHHDGIFFCNNSGDSSTVKDIYIYNNTFDGDIGNNATAWIYFNEGLNGIYVYNNVFLNTVGRVGTGSLVAIEGGIAGDQNFYVMNNFIDCNGPASWLGINVGYVTNLTQQNNALMRCGTWFLNNNVSGLFTNNNNVTNATTLGADSTGHPLSGSVLIHNGSSQYVNLSSLCTTALSLCTDKLGSARPTTGTDNWDAGAYMFSSGAAPAPPSGLQAQVQ